MDWHLGHYANIRHTDLPFAPNIIHESESFSKGEYESVVKDIREHYNLSYCQFPTYEHRLRILKAYMTSRKPRTFWEMWKDKRDSVQYYTFKGVIMLGAVSVVLALLSLAVSMAQTVATFQALNFQTGNASNSS